MRSWRIKDNLAAHWPLQSAVGDVTPDVSGHGYDGTLVNAPTWATGPFGGLQCIKLDGATQHVNVGDVTQLNAVAQFTLCGWMSQNVLDVVGYLISKGPSQAVRVAIWTAPAAGRLYLEPNGNLAGIGFFDYSTVISAGAWHHLAMVFDGSQVGNANRLVCYVDGAPVVLAFAGAVPATTQDLAGADMYIGDATFNSLDGRLWDWRLLTVAASRDEINQIIRSPVPYLV